MSIRKECDKITTVIISAKWNRCWGKVVHLVQRAPPSPASRHVINSSPSNIGNMASIGNMANLGNMANIDPDYDSYYCFQFSYILQFNPGYILNLVLVSAFDSASRFAFNLASTTDRIDEGELPIAQEIDNALFLDALTGRNMIIEENYGPSTSPTGARMDLVRRLISEIKQLLQNLSQTAQSAVP
ncbi:hypothetical protein EVAR_73093_1, partial [Eumeta japonica]